MASPSGGAAGRVVRRVWAAVIGMLGAAGRWWERLRPAQKLTAGYALYALIGAGLLWSPLGSAGGGTALDHLFNATSALSTTGLSTISVPDSYTFFGERVILVLFQVGAVGFMTMSSVVVLARSRGLPESRERVLRAGFALPSYFKIRPFILQVSVFTLAAELIGAAVLWWRFEALGVERALWHGVFHSVSAFATAGFSLNNSSLEAFRDDWVVNATVAVLCYLGAIGFIVVQDVWYSARLRERMLTLTSKTILAMTLGIFVIGTPVFYWVEPTMRELPVWQGVLRSGFQVMTASTTAGFNTVPIGGLSNAALVVLMIAMLIGASPSGTGGGIKTTSVSAVLANLLGVLRGRDRASWLGCDVPLPRVLAALAGTTLYLVLLMVGVLLLCITEDQSFLPVVFEAASAIGTVGLSMGITGELSALGKAIVIGLMFAGRVGPITLGLALLAQRPAPGCRSDDLAV